MVILVPLVWLKEIGLPTTTGDGVFLTLEDLSPLDLLRVAPELLTLAATLDSDPEVLTEEDVGFDEDASVVFDIGRAGCLTPDVMGLVLVPVKLITLDPVLMVAPACDV